jgi:hypothetical protein
MILVHQIYLQPGRCAERMTADGFVATRFEPLVGSQVANKKRANGDLEGGENSTSCGYQMTEKRGNIRKYS